MEELATRSIVDQSAFKLSMRQLAGAVSVITVGEGDERTGFTATSVSSLSAEAPSIIVSLNRGSSSWPVVERYRRFCVNVLTANQRHVAQSFAGFDGRQGAERYEDAQWYRLSTGTAALKDALTVLDCELETVLNHHSHAILIGRVCAIETREDVEPLLYWRGGYRRLSGEAVTCP
ncbi:MULTISPECIES: flavin reductase family protein [Rhizobium]|uniref:Flavin reductase domain-containing protein n=1 Tax=Rhizobium favelukesii TaxID=348824 RepID=W6S3T9_9HYPH|nr:MULTISPECIES: flavin reductase family protein [Rhizobium]MCS0460684.1 flavin reductase family protein [Rhizobium favelukesii]UFS85655.1 flavin reductase family protein [Rhizobium sp. T136]CDM60991.1 flavin reductase domain-containing protein [Rhizobium favelukesii]